MQTVTVEITNKEALKVLHDLQEKRLIKIRATNEINPLAIPGEPLTDEEFKNFILNREHGAELNFDEAKTKWAKKKKQVLKSGK